jgi:hypothetical protein
MDTNHAGQLPTRAGTIGGTLLSIFLQISGAEVLKTAVMAATGALVSFLVSLALQRALRRKRLR